MRNPLRDVIQSRLDAKEDAADYMYGVLGNGTIVEVPNKPGFVYVTLNDGVITQAYNVTVPNMLNFPVVVGYDKRQTSKNVLSVLTNRIVPRVGNTEANNYSTRAHHATHEWMNADGGTDIVYVQTRQLMALRPAPMGNWYLYINPDIQKINGSWSQVGGQTFYMYPRAINSYTAGSAGDERFVLVSLDLTSGSFAFTNGTLKAVGTSTLADIPATPTGHQAVCAIRFWTGQTDIIEALSGTDIADLRQARATFETLPHHATHENGGSDEISVAGLSGVLADAQNANMLNGIAVSGSPAVDDVLKYTGVNWIPGQVTGGGGGGGGGFPFWYVDGVITSGSKIGVTYVVPSDSAISSVTAYLDNTGVSGSTVVNIYVNGSAAFTSTTPPTISGSVKFSTAIPNIANLLAGDVVTMGITTAGSGATNLSVVMNGTAGYSIPGGSLLKYIYKKGTTDIITSGSAYVDMADMNAYFVTGNSLVEVLFIASIGNSITNGNPRFQMFLDNNLLDTASIRVPTISVGGGISISYMGLVTSGSHAVNVKWSQLSSSGSAYNRPASQVENRELIVKEYSLPLSTPNVVRVPSANDGWIPAQENWSYVSADAPNYVVVADRDISAVYWPGMRVKYNQSGSTGKGIIMAVSGSQMIIYGGTDFVVSNSAITLPYYSTQKAPFGFPLDPDKWTVNASGSVNQTLASPTINVLYNLATVQLVIPIGNWQVSYSVGLTSTRPANTFMINYIGLSTSGSARTDALLNSFAVESNGVWCTANHYKSRILNILIKTTYYLIESVAETGDTDIRLSTGWSCKAVCGYL